MRSVLLLLLFVVISGCGGSSTDPGGNPPPPPTGQAADLSIQAGDGQQADPGTAVAIPPAVLVKDAGGRPVAGASVQFTASAGGGTVSGATATSNAQGIATVGGWVLGQGDVQTLDAQVGSLSPAHFHATVTKLNEADIGPGGGILEINSAGTPFSGLRLTIPAGAFKTAGTWRIGVSASMPNVTLPAGFTVVGPALRIETTQGRADRMMTIRIPVQQVPGSLSVFLMFDPARNRMEMIPIIGRDQSSVTLGGSHFNPSLLLGPEQATAFRAGPASASGGVGYIIGAGAQSQMMLDALGFPSDQALAMIASQLWPAPETGSYGYPGGHGPAIALMEMFSSLSNLAIGPAIKLAWPAGPLADTAALAGLMTMAKRHFTGSPGASQVLADLAAAWAAQPPASRDSLTAINLRGMLMVSKVPQLMMFPEQLTAAPPGRVSRAVFAAMYGVANSTMWFSGPTTPLAPSGLTLGPNGFASRVANDVVGAPPFSAPAVLPLGGSFLYPVDQFADVPPAMMNALSATGATRDAANRSLATQAGFPDVVVEFQSTTGAPWVPADPTLEIRDSTAAVRTICRNCTNALQMYAVPEQQTVEATTNGTSHTGGASITPLGAHMAALIDALGIGNLVGVVSTQLDAALLDIPGVFGQLQRVAVPIHFPLLRRIFLIQPDSQLTTVSAPITLHAPVVNPPKLLPYEIAWAWGDGTTTVVALADSATHTYATTGTYQVKATLRYSAAGGLGPIPIAVARGKVTVAPPVFVWTFRSATVQSSTLPPGGIGAEATDTTIFNLVSGIVSNLLANPTNNSVAVLGIANGGPTCQAGAVLQRFPAGQVAASFDSTASFGLVGSCGDPDFSGNLTMGPLGNGTIIGSAAEVPNPDLITLPGGSINATMNGKNLTGTFVWNVRYSTGIGTYTVTFQALQAKP